MKKPLLKLLSGVAAFGLATSAYSLTILPTFDASITNDVNGAALKTAINYAILVEQSNFTDNVTVKIHFTNDLSTGLGGSSSWGNDYTYSTFLTALRNHATSRNDTNGLSKIPNSSTDPLAGMNIIYLNLAPARLLGLDSTYGTDGYDSTISLNMSLMNLTRPPGNSSKYDLAQVCEHEMDEVLGCSSDIGFPEISPIDLFRYTTNLSGRFRTYTTAGDNAYFSVDGTNLLARFNMNSGGNYSDWWSATGHWAPPGVTPHPQVQDAFATPNTAFDVGSNELAMLDVVGWTLAVVSPPHVKIVRSGANQFTLSWTNTASGFVLQERTNLLAGAWANATTGSTNPAVIVSTNKQKFYRLYNATATSHVLLNNAQSVVVSPPTTPPQLRVHVTHPAQP